MDTAVPALTIHQGFSWQRYLVDSVLACVGSLLITMIIFVFHLYPLIPNISIVYLLVVLALAATRGRYAAILAALVAFLSFDFFLVPPLFTLAMYRVEEWVALCIFLITAVLTGQQAVALRQRAEQASRREQETHTLYDLMRATNQATEPEQQLHVIAQAVVRVLSPWGVHDCALLEPNDAGTLEVVGSAYQPCEEIKLSRDEQAVAAWVMTHGRMMGLYEDAPLAPSTSKHFAQHVHVTQSDTGWVVPRSLRLLPLKLGSKVNGVLRLRVMETSRRFPDEDRLEQTQNHSDTAIAFFWTFLEQVTALLERARLQRESVRMAVLQRTDALRAALLASVSHDLRTPLTSITTAATSLMQEEVEWSKEARLAFARSIAREAGRLNRLVENLLDMSRIEEGALRPEKEQCSLTGLIHEVLDRLIPLFEERTVRTMLPADLLQVEVDYVQIDQVLTNLLENAVRYTPEDSPIEVSACMEGSQVVLSVADRGPGIPPEDLERIFDKFYRVSPGRHSGEYPTGSGLGLAVCKGLVEANGGRIWAALREGGGLIVSVALPRSFPLARSDQEEEEE